MDTARGHITWGIIGCGDVAEVKSGPAFQKCQNSSLLAVMRRDGERAADFAHRHGVPLWYDDATELLQNDEINAVYIATPPASHLSLAEEALQAGKHVYLEKPMVLNLKQAEELSVAVSESDSKLVVAHYRRYLPMYVKIKDLLSHKAIGTVQFADIRFLKEDVEAGAENWRRTADLSGGGLFYDLAPHQIDLMYYYFGEYVSALGRASDQSGRYKVNDIVNGVIHFENDVHFRGLWHFDIGAYMTEDNCTIYGSRGSISFSFYDTVVTIIVDGVKSELRLDNPAHVQQPMIQETVDYFLNKRNNPCSVDEGLKVAAIMDGFTT